MLTAGLNALAFACFGGLRLFHSGGREGFGFLLTGMAGIGVAIWAVARMGRGEPARD
jgi:hypothetical protein